jgi:hypothetical protein
MATQRTTQIQPTTINDPVNLPDPVVNFLLVGVMVLPLAIMALRNLKNLGSGRQ